MCDDLAQLVYLSWKPVLFIHLISTSAIKCSYLQLLYWNRMIAVLFEWDNWRWLHLKVEIDFSWINKTGFRLKFSTDQLILCFKNSDIQQLVTANIIFFATHKKLLHATQVLRLKGIAASDVTFYVFFLLVRLTNTSLQV